MAHPKRPPVRLRRALPEEPERGDEEQHRVHLPGQPPDPRASRGVSRSKTTARPASTGTATRTRCTHRGARSSRSSSRARTEPTRSATHTPKAEGGRARTGRPAPTRSRRTGGSGRAPAGRGRRAPPPPRGAGSGGTPAATGCDSSITAVATITAHSSAGRSVELQRRRARPSRWTRGSRRWRSSPTGRRTPS